MSTNEKKWWESTGGILSIISILLTVFLSWDSCSEKLFGKYSTSSLVGTWTYTDVDEQTFDGLNATIVMTSNGQTEYKKRGRFYRNVDMNIAMVFKVGDEMKSQTISLEDVTSEGKYEIVDDNIRTIVERTNILQKVKEQLGDSKMFTKLFEGQMENNATERKIV